MCLFLPKPIIFNVVYQAALFCTVLKLGIKKLLLCFLWSCVWTTCGQSLGSCNIHGSNFTVTWIDFKYGRLVRAIWPSNWHIISPPAYVQGWVAAWSGPGIRPPAVWRRPRPRRHATKRHCQQGNKTPGCLHVQEINIGNSLHVQWHPCEFQVQLQMKWTTFGCCRSPQGHSQTKAFVRLLRQMIRLPITHDPADMMLHATKTCSHKLHW